MPNPLFIGLFEGAMFLIALAALIGGLFVAEMLREPKQPKAATQC
jgi:hypothetical protein